MYQFDSRVRYSETDVSRKMTLPAVLNYFQDCSIFHSEACGVGLDYLQRRHCTWMLSAWQIVIGTYPVLGQEIVTQTWAYDFHVFLGYRNFCILDRKGGEKLAWANSVWSYIDVSRGHPTKPPQAEVDAYSMDEKLDMTYEPRKIALTGEGREQEHFSVLRHHLDTNHHVNNGQFVQMAMSFLPEGFAIRQMRAEYKKEAHLGDTIVPYVRTGTESYTISLCDEEGKPYAVVEFSQ